MRFRRYSRALAVFVAARRLDGQLLMRVMVGVATAALTVMVLSSCGNVAPDATREKFFAYYEDESEGGDMSVLSGALKITDGCLVVVADEEGGVGNAPLTYLPVFPHDRTHFDGVSLYVSGKEVGRVGEEVELVGGRSTVSDAAIPENCPTDLAQFVVASR